MVKFIMSFHEVVESYLSAVQQITPIFAYMVSIMCFLSMCVKLLVPDSLVCRFQQVSYRCRHSLKKLGASV
jgi:hypothetical protein